MAVLLSIGLVFACFASAAFAAPISSEQARSAAAAWRVSERQPLNCVLGAKVLRVESGNDSAGNALYHVVFLTDDGVATRGLVVMSADDEAEPIMAISSGSEFGAKPDDPLMALVNHHSDGVLRKLRKVGARKPEATASAAVAKAKWSRLLSPKASAEAAPSAAGPGSMTTVSDVRVAPLIKSTWNQTTANNYTNGPACYNYYTPPYAAGSSNNYYCGCTATAFGQIMRYWQYPTTSVGAGSFPIEIQGAATTGTLRGGNGLGGPYQWASMPLSPTGSITTAQAEAIGDLIHDAALAAETDFTPSGSAGYPFYAVAALLGTFHYANGVDVYGSVSIATNTVISIITPSLDAGCPVDLGISGAGGHEVICDGYGYNSGTLYNHLNFGWGGDDNVWYALPTENTDNGDFNIINECSFNIFPTGSGEIISGRVTDSSGNPLSGVKVSAAISGAGTYSAVSGSTGIYAIRPVPGSSTFSVSASLAGYFFASQIVSTGDSVSGTLDPGYSNEGSAGSKSGINFEAVPTPAITSASSASGTNGAAFAYQIKASNSPTGYNATGLPAGLSVNKKTGLISGVPTEGGVFAVTISATNAGGTRSTTLTLTFTVNFKGVTGTYNGLAAVNGTNEGLFAVTLGGTGGFTGELEVAGGNYPLKGTLSTYGTFKGTVGALNLDLTVNAALPGVSGTIAAITATGTTSYGVKSSLLKVFTAGTIPAGLAGNYTAVFPALSGTNPALPHAPGYCTMTVGTTGAVNIAGKLGDGTALTAGGQLHADGKTWALYARLYTTGTSPGGIAGTMTFESTADGDCDGTLAWIKPRQTTGSYYRAGFSASAVDLVAAKYAAPPLTTGTAALSLGGGNLPESDIIDSLAISSTDIVTVNGVNHGAVTVTLTPASGAFTGTFDYPGTNTVTAFGGVIYQKPAPTGYGLFLGTSQAGSVEITR